MELNDFGNAIRITRKELGLTQMQLSIVSEVDQAVISKCENGKKVGGVAMDKILEILEIRIPLTFPRK